jgi:UDPglucose 6-dehydrogenase
MKLAVIGTGYVGLVAGVCFAEVGNETLCVDVDQAKLERLQLGELPIYEPGLEHLFARNLREKRLRFTDDLQCAVDHAEIIFLALPTPPTATGEADLSYILGAARDIGKLIKKYTVIVTKSTVPVGTADKVRAAIAEHAACDFDVASNPEFLREGVAVEDFLKPERVVLGVSSERAEKVLRELYHPFVLSGNPVLVMDTRSAEITKYAANAMLAVRISFMNDIANLCDACGANVDWVRLGVGLDSRIGKRFLFAGTGYGGSCFPKDVSALVETGREFGAPQRLPEATQQINENQKKVLLPRIEQHFDNNLQGKTFAMWGIAFKPNTDDIREAPALTIIEALVARGAKVQAYDPEAMPGARKVLAHCNGQISWGTDPYAACEGADALILVTEWGVFREPDFGRLKQLLKSHVIFDGRNIYGLDTMRDHGFDYYSIGRPPVQREKPTFEI